MVVYDETISQNILDSFKLASLRHNTSNCFLAFDKGGDFPLKEYSLFTSSSTMEHKKDLPNTILAAIGAADVMLFLLSDISIMFSAGLKEALKQGKRAVFIPYATERAMLRLMPTSSGEVNALRERTSSLAGLFVKSNKATVTSTAGTDVTMELGSYETRFNDGIAEPGKMVFLPGGIVSRVPNDYSANGVFVIDRSISAPEFKELCEPIKLEVSRGNVVGIEGGKEARNLKRFLESLDDPNVYHLTELQIGTNPQCKFASIDNPIEHTHTLGTVSLALGCDTHIGGRFPGKVHIDSTLHNPSLLLDENMVVENGTLRTRELTNL